MESNVGGRRQRSVYRRGADDGLWFGLYLSVMFIAMACSLDVPILSLVFLLMAAGVPVATYRSLKKSFRIDEGRSSFSALWLHGICMFFFGSLLLSVTVYVFLRFIHPEYIPELVRTAYEYYSTSGSPSAHEIADVLRAIQDNRLYPTAGGVAVEMIWLAVFTGSLLSMAISAVVRYGGRGGAAPRSQKNENV